MEKKTLEFASLLHDIGKFYQRTDYTNSKNNYCEYKNLDEEEYECEHAIWSAGFINENFDEETAELALYHHKPNNAKNSEHAKIIHLAEHDAAGEAIKNYKNKSISPQELSSIFSRIWIKPDKNKEKPVDYYLPLKELDLDNFNELIPRPKQDKDLDDKYTKLWDKFEKEIESLKSKNFNSILSLLHKYTTNIPSEGYKYKPDISLYDHSKITTALTVSRYLYNTTNSNPNNSDKVYMIINGDISGIQKFIFKISSPDEAQKGMSKRLRGRSLYLTLLTDAISSCIIENLELTKANILFCGGGRFTIIAPNTPEVLKKLDIIEENVNEEFIKKFNAELYLSIATEEASGEDLKEFGEITTKLSKKLNENKKHKFVNNLDKLFNTEDVGERTTCPVCGNLYPKSEKNKKKFCLSCEKHEELGKDVANAIYMIKYFFNDNIGYDDDKQLLFDNSILKIGYEFVGPQKDKEKVFDEIKKLIHKYGAKTKKVEIIKLNDTDFLEFENKFSNDELEKISFSFSFMGNTVPKYPNRIPLYFEHLTQISRGANKLGVLKMDVDDLGLIFSKGFNHLKGEDNSKPGSNISRISTLSSQLDLFFSGVINKIASKYFVYSEKINEILDKDTLDEYFYKIKLELQSATDKNKGDYLSVYKLKYDVELDDELNGKLEEYKIPTIYINYSGGDDLLVLGPYDDIIKFGYDLRKEFKEWTCKNDSINLSAGINIISAKFPIGKAVDMAENYLETSKSCGKDKITLFNETVSWNMSSSAGFDDLFKFASDLEKWYSQGNNGVSKSFIYSLLHMWQYSYKGNTELISNESDWCKNISFRKGTKKYVPIFKYKLRLIKDPEIRDKINNKVIEFMPWIRIPVSWVSLRTR